MRDRYEAMLENEMKIHEQATSLIHHFVSFVIHLRRDCPGVWRKFFGWKFLNTKDGVL